MADIRAYLTVVGRKRRRADGGSGDDDDDTSPTLPRAVVERPRLGGVCVTRYRPGVPPRDRPGYRTILIHTSSRGLGGSLSPFVLRDEHGHLLENIWQFAKVYARVSAQRVRMSQRLPTIIWEHPAEVHCTDGGATVTPAYWRWRAKGRSNPFAVRYPNGFVGRTQCLFSLWPRRSGGVDGDGDDEPTNDNMQRLNYIEARQRIYCGEYARLAPRTECFARMRALLEAGVNLQLCEVDGPDTSLTHYPYAALSADRPWLDIGEPVIRALVKDPVRPFGHGFTIAALLLGGAEWMT